MSQQTQKPIAFITNDIKLDQADWIITQIESYNPLRYIVVFEHPPGGYPHYHYLIWISDNQYNALIKKIRLKYNLIGQTKKNQRKQYGRIKNIEDIDKLISYMLKDQEPKKIHSFDAPTLWYNNITEEDIIKYKQQSFKKNEATETCYKCIKYVKENVEQKRYSNYKVVTKEWSSTVGHYVDEFSYEKQAKLLMIEFHIKNKLRINKTTLNNYYIEYLKTMHYDELKDLESTTHNIYDKLFE